MSIRELYSEPLGDELVLTVIEVREPNGAVSNTYEVSCPRCDTVDIYDRRSAALSADHVCGGES